MPTLQQFKRLDDRLRLELDRQLRKKQVVSLFTLTSLTDGRSARDLPKQHPEKMCYFALFIACCVRFCFVCCVACCVW